MNATTTIAPVAGYDTIRDWLSQRCAIHYPEHKRELLQQRLARVQRAYGLRDLAALAHRITVENVHEVQLAVMHAASTNHTYFFREMEVLDQFKTMILPTLTNRSEIRLWSAACSTGDEAYTLAIIIAETLGMAALKRTQILGTDISEPVVMRAEQGIFARRQLEHTPPDIRRKYFVPTGIDQYQIIPEIRACCTFRRMNLKTTPYPFKKPFQAVFCRNILYYFAREDQVATVEAIYEATEPGGWLVTSVTENVRDLSKKWQVLSSGISRKGGQ